MKLVRDNIPERHPQHKYRTAEGGELEALLRLKLVEEAAEVASARNTQELVEELGDVLEVIQAIRARYGISIREVTEAQLEKWDRLGGFEEGVIMTDYIESDGEK